MASENKWYTSIPLIIKTALATILPKQLRENYPLDYEEKYKFLYVTDNEAELKKADFPSILIKRLPFSEVGEDLDGESINGIIASFQIEVYTNTTQSDADDISAEIIEIMKRMRFKVNQFPNFRNTDNVMCSIMRFRRTIGADDTFSIM